MSGCDECHGGFRYPPGQDSGVFPCPDCQPALFLRWTDGDWPEPRKDREVREAAEVAARAAEVERERADLR